MKRILIVEDNQTLAKLIAKKISDKLDFEVDLAYSLKEAKLFLKMYKYFICLLDINLPDAPNGEIVDYVVSKNQHAMVLSGNIDKDFREKMLSKNIIDYINKSGVNDIHYVIQAIKRLQKNKSHKIMLVDNSIVSRNKLKEMLQNMYFEVITVAHGEEALGMLQVHPDISLIITDYKMPVIDGLELTQEIRKEYTKEQMAIIALSSNEDINVMFLKSGANDYIKKPFAKEEFICRVNNTIEALENLQFITNSANRDSLTGLYNRRYFYSHMKEYLDETSNSEKYAIAMINIDNFKEIEAKYETTISNKMIIQLSEILRSSTNYRDLVARFSGEEFCVVLKNVNKYSALDILQRAREDVQKNVVVANEDEHISFTISVGAVMSSEESLEETIDQADMMLHNAKKEGQNSVLMQD